MFGIYKLEDTVFKTVILISLILGAVFAVNFLDLNIVKTVDHTEAYIKISINQEITGLEKTIRYQNERIAQLELIQPPDYSGLIFMAIMFFFVGIVLGVPMILGHHKEIKKMELEALKKGDKK